MGVLRGCNPPLIFKKIVVIRVAVVIDFPRVAVVIDLVVTSSNNECTSLPHLLLCARHKKNLRGVACVSAAC